MEAYEWSGQWWTFRNKVSSYRPVRNKMYKSLGGLGSPEEDAFWHIMDECQREGLKPPSSFTDIWQQMVHMRRPIWSLSASFADYFVGGWQKAFVTGYVEEECFQYDINSAYRWAGEVGLWDLRTAKATKDFRATPAVFLVEAGPGWRPYHQCPGLQMVTSEERDALSLSEPIRVVTGYQFSARLMDMRPFFDLIDRLFPSCAKHMGRTYWGAWGSQEPVYQCSQNGSRPLRSLHLNPIFAHLIVSRVKCRLVETMREVEQAGGRILRVYVDSLTTTDWLRVERVGPARGQFRNERWFPRGLIIYSSGVQAAPMADGRLAWITRSGITSAAAESFIRNMLEPMRHDVQQHETPTQRDRKRNAKRSVVWTP